MATTQNKYCLKSTLAMLAVLLFQVSELKAQDLQFSQFNNSKVLLNPSEIGAIDGKMRLTTNYKNQWGSISAPFRTLAFSFDTRLSKGKNETGFLGIGISVLSDKAGSSQLGSNQMNLSLAYHLKVSERNYLSAGLIGGFVQHSLDYTNLQWNSQYDRGAYNADLPTNELEFSENQMYADLGVGLNWTHTSEDVFSTSTKDFKVNVGLAVFHVNRPNNTFYSFNDNKLPMRMVLHASSQISIVNGDFALVPTVLFVKQASSTNATAGLFLRKPLKGGIGNDESAISIGALYQVGDAFIPYWQLEIFNFTLGVSYDINNSDLSRASSAKGGIEISLSWTAK
ncbi:MAG: PorP/SprF family type IX secretion system membrane protein [Flavobacteriales bacterium]|nr:PorP/SprF family type IX secretion system membrane protein [Flavobacteriales bacterium]